MAYKCLECGNIFDEGEQANWSESRGEFWGVASSENMSGCPLCKGEFEETIPCAICGSEHLAEELSGGVCNDCIDEYKHDVDVCFNIGAEDTESVELNCFLTSIFSKEEIEEILLAVLQERNGFMRSFVNDLCEKFVENDRNWFGERLAEEVKK